MRINKHTINVVYTVFVIVALASLDNAVIGLFPPLFSSIASDFNIQVSSLGIVSAVNILITSLSSIVWGYLADKGHRKRLIIIGTIIWSISVFFTAYSQNYIQLLLFQVFTGIGLGCIASIGYSLLTDYIPKKSRGLLLSLWGMSQGFGGIAGSIMASIIATATTWRKPFEIIAVLGLLFTFLYFFIKEPKKGSTEPELKEMVKEGLEYNYHIEFHHIKEIISKKSNKWLVFQGLFMNITTGTLIWLPTLYIAKITVQGYRMETAIISAGFLYALLQVGGLASMYFGHLGDIFQRHTHRGRSLLTALLLIIAVPLYTLMFLTPMKNLSIPNNGNSILIFFELIKDIITNPWMFLTFLLAVGATAAQSANTPNSLAILTDVNLPEHRATIFSFANLINGIGRSMGNILIGIVLSFFTAYQGEPYNYIFTLLCFQIFLIPSAFCYFKISKNMGRDIRRNKSLLKKRAKQSS